jgi:hypothetical protein
MNCGECQSQFADVLDHGLEWSGMKPIEKHLAECSVCREELAGLLECRRLVASLPEIDPPSGFVSRIMAHVHESAKSPRAWERLFLPLRVKIPLQAAAVVIIGVMSVYVYQREDRQNPPSPTIASVTPSTAPADTAAGSGAAVQSDTGSEIPQKAARRARVAPRQLHSGPRINAPHDEPVADPLPQPAKQEIRRTIPIPAQGVIAAMGPSAPSRAFRADREFSNLGEPVPDYELFVRRRSSQERDQEADTQTKRADGENSSKPIEPNRRTETQAASASIVDVLWYTIPQDRYDDFKKELSTQATIESENAVGAKDKHSSFRADGPFYVKVIVLSPTER